MEQGRLIDADALMQSEIKRCGRVPTIGTCYFDETSFRTILDQAPIVDAVEVVRCKDCQLAKPYERNDGKTGYYCQFCGNTFRYGGKWERLFAPVKEADDFCSYGEMKNNE